MFRLKLPTDPRWINIVEKNISEILTDHAWCEQKAASTAISLIVQYPELTELTKAMIALAQEELMHFKMVHDKIIQRGLKLGKPRKDEYANLLYAFMRRGGTREQQLMDHLLFAALIEARSCERFRILSLNISDKDLAFFYHDLMISEASHYTTFINLARKYDGKDEMPKRWQEFLNYEAEIIRQFGVKETIHG